MIDDSKTIAAVNGTLVANPGMSRRAAIIAHAGEGNLRRLEMKMQRLEAEAPLALDGERRAAVAADFLGLYPASVRTTGYRDVRLVVNHPPDAVGNRMVLVDVLGCFVSGYVARSADLGAASDTGDLGWLDPFADIPCDVLDALARIGLLPTPGEEAWPHPGGPCHRDMAMALLREWRRHGLGAHVGEAALVDEASALVSANLDAAGIGKLLDRFPAGFGEAVSAARSLDGGEGSLELGTWITHLLERPAHVGLALRMGPLAYLLHPHSFHDVPDASLPVAEIVYRCLRTNCLGNDTTVSPDDAAWLAGLARVGAGAAWLHAAGTDALLANRDWVAGLGTLSAGDARGLVRLVACIPPDTARRFSGERLLDGLRRIVPSAGSLSETWSAVSGLAEARGTSAGAIIADGFGELAALRTSLWSCLASQVADRARDRIAATFGDSGRPSWTCLGTPDIPGLRILRERRASKGRDLTARVMGQTDLLIAGDRDVAGILGFALAWMDAGRPGCTTSYPRDHGGTLADDAFWCVLDEGPVTQEAAALARFVLGIDRGPEGLWLGADGEATHGVGETACQALVDDLVPDLCRDEGRGDGRWWRKAGFRLPWSRAA